MLPHLVLFYRAGLSHMFAHARTGDGIIGVEDLEASLAHVAVSCCRTRCIYRAPRGLAHKLLAQTQAAGETDGRWEPAWQVPSKVHHFEKWDGFTLRIKRGVQL